MKIFVFILLSAFYVVSFGQSAPVNKYIIRLTDKNGVTFNPYDFFDIKAIERRMREGISLSDTTDFPVRQDYISMVSGKVNAVKCISRWLNAIIAEATENQINEIEKLSCVKKIIPLHQTVVVLCSEKGSLSRQEENLLNMQTWRMQGDLFIKNNIDGNGIRIAVFDGGFPDVDIHPAFQHIVESGRIIKTWDFSRNKENVYKYSSHGTGCLSCIAGKCDDKPVGLATGAEFLLARTEVNTEPFSEEENWLAAAEWADKNGADIISSSLGYTIHRYFPDQMNGKTSLVAKAAAMAAAKGILVVTAMGNDGDSKWRVLSTPADVDSVLSVGGIDPEQDYHIGFSSYGPTADHRLKPNVVAYGSAIIARPGNRFSEAQGTSFATPLIAGFAACAWQTNRNLKAMELLRLIQQSADLYPFYDYAHGYGVPQASFFMAIKDTVNHQAVKLIRQNDEIFVHIGQTTKTNQGFQNQNFLYFHIRNPKGMLLSYKIFRIYSTDPFKVADIAEIPAGCTIMVYCNKAYDEMTFQSINK